ncbi:serine hydrolase domain-containing protein [Arcticibacterium luteifluviistationis]|uniref:Serine hydrolase n=1 Tax=Arcticibacterium luteifluviistationis TaxID=1784714 RepID=A0A2Z4GDE8_9BACT|nr:serine hydrolase domain-containing protein [Arcticibacterium luteifluviistationis]AWV99266.1 serine hydrolase [Arcticibacterium luteifluviistationis]
MKKILFVLMAVCCTAYSQTPSIQKSGPLTAASPESVGMSGQRLDRIDAMINRSMAENVIPGAVAIITRNGKIVYQKAFGQSDVQAKKAFETNSIFRIASQSKAITTTAVMMLWEEGHFFLDDPISKYIPEFKNPTLLDRFNLKDSSYTTKPAGREITIRQLMNHTSGLGYGVIDSDQSFKAIYKKAGVTDLFTTEDIPIGESVKKLAKLPLHHVPGEAYVYSEGIDVLGYFVEVISGMKLDEYLSQHIFKPLGMNDTYFYLPKGKANRLVEVQTKRDDKWIPFSDDFYDVNYPKTGAKTFFSGGAGLSSTVFDYATFLQMYLNGGELNGTRLLSRKTVEFMLENQVGELFGKDAGFGLGFSILNEKGAADGGKGSEGTFRWGGYFNTQYFADPVENTIGIIMKQTQQTGGDYTGDMFRQMVFQSIDD